MYANFVYADHRKSKASATRPSTSAQSTSGVTLDSTTTDAMAFSFYFAARGGRLFHHPERIGHGVLIAVVPEVLQDEAVFREVVDEGRQHVVGSGQLPVGLQLAGEREGGDGLRAGIRHAQHRGFGLVAVPAAAGVDHREHLVAVLQHRERRKGAAGADGDAGDDDMPASGPGHQTFEGVAERRVFVGVDDAGAAIDRLLDEDLLYFRKGVAVLPLRVG